MERPLIDGSWRGQWRYCAMGEARRGMEWGELRAQAQSREEAVGVQEYTGVGIMASTPSPVRDVSVIEGSVKLSVVNEGGGDPNIIDT